MKTIAWIALLLSICLPLHAQTLDDGIMMRKGSLQTGAVYSHDRWNEYWEGSLKRVNGNIGTITTETTAWTAVFGLTDRVSVMGSLPRVSTNASLGVLAGQSGVQDATVGGKFSALEWSPSGHGLLRGMAALSGSLPVTNYNPDFAPMSIGTHSRKVSGRGTLNYQSAVGIYVNGTAAYTWRSDVTLDRPYYYTGGQLFLTDTVDMPSVVDYAISAGFLRYDLNTNVTFSRMVTQGGGDIRRQDMPFLSNRMIASRIGGMAMRPIPKLRIVSLYLSLARVLDGRNVGQSTTYAVGLLYSHASRTGLIR